MEKSYVINVSGKSFSKCGDDNLNISDEPIPYEQPEPQPQHHHHHHHHQQHEHKRCAAHQDQEQLSTEKPFECDSCGKCFAQKSHLKQHSMTHSGEKPFKCEVCGDTFSRNGNLNRHMSIHGEAAVDRKSEVISPDSELDCKDNLQKPITVVNKPYKCQVCGCSFSRNGDLTRHLRTHGTALPPLVKTESPRSTCTSSCSSPVFPIQNPFNCEVCWEAFTQRSKLSPVVHERMHKALNPFKCDYCGKCFSQKTHLTVHTARIHCGSKTSSASKASPTDLSSTSTKEKSAHENPLNCEICWKVYSQRNHADLHKRIHAAVLPFECNICSHVFTDRGEWKRHQRTHLGKNLFECDLCSKTFLERSHLKVHRKIHTGERPFKCTICQFAFARKDHLERHLRGNKCEGRLHNLSGGSSSSDDTEHSRVTTTTTSTIPLLHLQQSRHVIKSSYNHTNNNGDTVGQNTSTLVAEAAAAAGLDQTLHEDGMTDSSPPPPLPLPPPPPPSSSSSSSSTHHQHTQNIHQPLPLHQQQNLQHLDFSSQQGTVATPTTTATNNSQMYPATIQMYPTGIQLYPGTPVFPTIQGTTFLCI